MSRSRLQGSRTWAAWLARRRRGSLGPSIDATQMWDTTAKRRSLRTRTVEWLAPVIYRDSNSRRGKRSKPAHPGCHLFPSVEATAPRSINGHHDRSLKIAAHNAEHSNSFEAFSPSTSRCRETGSGRGRSGGSAFIVIDCVNWAAGAEEVHIAVGCRCVSASLHDSCPAIKGFDLPSSSLVTLGQNFFSFSHGRGYAAFSCE